MFHTLFYSWIPRAKHVYFFLLFLHLYFRHKHLLIISLFEI